MPDMCHDRVVKFVCIAMSRSCVLPDVACARRADAYAGQCHPVATILAADNIACGQASSADSISELDALKLREKTLVIFMGDNGTGKGIADRATIGGKVLSGMKGTMLLECGGLVPMIACWPGKTPAGRVCAV